MDSGEWPVRIRAGLVMRSAPGHGPARAGDFKSVEPPGTLQRHRLLPPAEDHMRCRPSTAGQSYRSRCTACSRRKGGGRVRPARLDRQLRSNIAIWARPRLRDSSSPGGIKCQWNGIRSSGRAVGRHVLHRRWRRPSGPDGRSATCDSLRSRPAACGRRWLSSRDVSRAPARARNSSGRVALQAAAAIVRDSPAGRGMVCVVT